jgi:hypothetical protein
VKLLKEVDYRFESCPDYKIKIYDMKKWIKDFRKTMVDVCYPIDPFPVYMFLVLALLSPVIVTLLEKS